MESAAVIKDYKVPVLTTSDVNCCALTATLSSINIRIQSALSHVPYSRPTSPTWYTTRIFPWEHGVWKTFHNAGEHPAMPLLRQHPSSSLPLKEENDTSSRNLTNENIHNYELPVLSSWYLTIKNI